LPLKLLTGTDSLQRDERTKSTAGRDGAVAALDLDEAARRSRVCAIF
jgi:hypothetical protein